MVSGLLLEGVQEEKEKETEFGNEEVGKWSEDSKQCSVLFKGECMCCENVARLKLTVCLEKEIL